MRLVSASEMQEMDKRTIDILGIPGRVLMENAGLGASKTFTDFFNCSLDKKIGIVAGGGNNGGDGFVIARYLNSWGYDVHVFLMTDQFRITGDAKTNLDLLEPLSIPMTVVCDKTSFNKLISVFNHVGIWVDALLGTGLKSTVRSFYSHVITFINKSGKPVFSVDVPSGLNSDTGHANGISVVSDITATFGFAKTGHVVYPGMTYTGKLEVIEIGIPPYISNIPSSTGPPEMVYVTEEFIASHFESREINTHKGTCGHLLALGGSPGKTGAMVMSCLAAMRSGAGLVTCGIPEGRMSTFETQVVECMSLPLPETGTGYLSEKADAEIIRAMSGKSCLVLGPGMGTEPQTANLVCDLLKKCTVPLVIDADGLNCLSQNTMLLKTADIPVVLTPHPREMARLTNTSVEEVQKDRVSCCREFALQFGVYIVLKGAGTVIACPDGRVFVNSTGNPGMASGGMGDVLTGIIAGLVCQGFEPETAAVSGVYIHGAAADFLKDSGCIQGYLATDVINAVPKILDRLIKNECNKK